MADKESRSDAKDEGNKPGLPDADDSAKQGTAPLRPAQVHRTDHSPLTNAE